MILFPQEKKPEKASEEEIIRWDYPEKVIKKKIILRAISEDGYPHLATTSSV